MKLAAVILTLDEERHLGRCIASLQEVADEIIVVDSGSQDRTLSIAERAGAVVLRRDWVNPADQFNWALGQLDEDVAWVLRIDADEYLSLDLAAEIRRETPLLGDEVTGVLLKRRLIFQGRRLRFGGLFPIHVLRLFRRDCGRSENRWMDEHIVVEGDVTEFQGELIDENLGSLSEWTNKHNRYASCEALELLDLQLGFTGRSTASQSALSGEAGAKRWLKERVYAKLPGGVRALVYFLYRYFLRLGFLDGTDGARFHVLQGFWYRYLVDAKVAEVKRYMQSHDVSAVVAIRDVLGIDVGRRSEDGSAASLTETVQ